MSENKIGLDLFKLHDLEKDDAPKKWICAKGKNLKAEIKKIIEYLNESRFSNPKLIKHFVNKLNISSASADRLVYLRKEWLPLVFIEEALSLAGKSDQKLSVLNEIEFLKANQPPLRFIKAAKKLTPNLCKIAGAHAADGTMHNNFFCITDGYKSNIDAFKNWLKEEFGVEYQTTKISANEFGISFNNKVFTRYLNKILGFPSGNKVYFVKEPDIIKNSTIELRKAFALGALTFEAGVGISRQIEFCVSSKEFQKSICEILGLLDIKYTKMERQSNGYWRFWSKRLNQEEAKKLLNLFEPETEKWFKLYEYANGYQGKANSIEEAVSAFGMIYSRKSSSKISIKEVILSIKELKETHRYALVEHLVNKLKLKSYGGKWGNSLKHYLDILKSANIIKIEKMRFGKKKSWGSIIRDNYIYNPNVDEWKVPLRNQ